MKLSPFYYPTTIACVDDDNLFLNTLSKLLQEKTKTLCFNNPLNAVDFFKNYRPILSDMNFLKGCAENEEYDLINHMPVDLNQSALKELRNNQSRYSDISVVISDYNMPFMDGITFCRTLQTLPVKKVLLTGEADFQQAVTAFNEGIIDCFIRKDSPNLVEEIAEQIQKLSTAYLLQSTSKLVSHLETDYSLPISDAAFVKFFQEYCQKNKIAEYYLIDKFGNFLLINEQGEKSYFIVHTDRTLNNFVELHGDNEEAVEFIRAVKTRQKVPFFGEGLDSWELEMDKWADCFYSSTVWTGIEKYYWAVAA